MRGCLLLLLLSWLGTGVCARRTPWLALRPRHSWFGSEKSQTSRPDPAGILTCPRGGGEGDSTDTTTATTAQEEEERYSRQVYAVGKRAQGLIRSTTVYLDGPASSGLLYETAKNLALSGIRKLVLVVDEDSNDIENTSSYHNPRLDDLGRAYLRAARTELAKDDTESATTVLAEYIQRLNPFVDVSVVDSTTTVVADASSNGGRHVWVSLDRPYAMQVTRNDEARQHGMSFVAVETAGVFGRIFCDFGNAFEVFDTDGETPLVTPLLRVEAVVTEDDSNRDDEQLVTIHCMEGEKHDVSKGDTVRFQFRNGDYSDATCKVEKVQTPYRFTARLDGIDASTVLEQWSEAVSFSRVKIPQTIEFVSLKQATEQGATDGSMFTACDLDKSWDDVRRRSTFSCFQALDAFVKQHERLPDINDRKAFSALVAEIYGEGLNGPAKKHVKSFLSGCAAKFGPLQAVFGAIGAQEALKAATGLYSPVKQFLLYDCDEVLRNTVKNDPGGSCAESGDDSGLRHILGDETVDKMQSSRVFVVGAGAIGCEILKNLAVMGAGTKNDGKILLTDMDTIEKSNLSRQFLFRDADIGKFKSMAAKESVLRFQPLANIEAHSAKVGASEDNAFGGNFWSKEVDTVLNALDNVDARVFIDGQCVANQKSLVDAGTLGPKGNVQVVVPFQSESYSSSVDPPDEAIPVCTLKNFPYAISHTIQWGRDLFDGYFRSRPAEATKFVSSLNKSNLRDLVAQVASTMGEEAVVAWADNLSVDLKVSNDPNEMVSQALDWAATMAWKLYYQSIKELLEEHPLDSRDEDGELFWSGSRRPPTPLEYLEATTTTEEEAVNSNLEDFVQNTARLRVESYKVAPEKGLEITKEDAREALRRFSFASHESQGQSRKEENEGAISRALSKLDGLDLGNAFPRLAVAEFEKDDESNGHVAFVTAASNLRAICYGIPPVDAMETRRIAGNIIPAMITTTAFVSAISCIEMIKLVQETPLQNFRNAFINLALPFFAFTVPLPAEPVPGLQGREYTLWDRLSVKESKKVAESGGLTMKSLINKLKKLASDEPSCVSVASISLGPYLLYASFLHEDDRSLLKSTVWDTIAEALEDPELDSRGDDGDSSPVVFSTSDTSFDLTVVVEDMETGEEAELPAVSLKRYTKK